MIHFYFFRHGETEWNALGKCQGHTDIPLNESGKAQALRLRQKLDKLGILPELEIIYTSDLSRAQETAEIVSNQKIPLHVTSLLRETRLGDIEGMNKNEAIDLVGREVWESFRYLGSSGLEVRFPGGESRGEVLTRVRACIKEAVTQGHKHIGISTHGGALRNYLHTFLPDQAEALKIENCVLYQLNFCSRTNSGKIKGPL